jgi:hypothetical protein
MERVHHKVTRLVGLRAATILLSFAALGAVGAESDKNPTVTTPPAPALCASQPDGNVPATLAQWAEGAQLFIGLGDFHRAVSTSSKSAQAYFDQGMRFLWAFNHDESTLPSLRPLRKIRIARCATGASRLPSGRITTCR